MVSENETKEVDIHSISRYMLIYFYKLCKKHYYGVKALTKRAAIG